MLLEEIGKRHTREDAFRKLTVKEVNQRLRDLEKSFIWKLMPGTEVTLVAEDQLLPCKETINGVTYTSKLGTEKIRIIYKGIEIIDDEDAIKEGYIEGRFHNEKFITFEQAYKYFGLKKEIWGHKGYLTKDMRYKNTAFAVRFEYLDGRPADRGVWLMQIEKDRMYFNFGLNTKYPFFNAYIEPAEK